MCKIIIFPALVVDFLANGEYVLKAFHFWPFIINSANMPKSIFYEF